MLGRFQLDQDLRAQFDWTEALGQSKVQQPLWEAIWCGDSVLPSIIGAGPLEGRRSLAAAGRRRRQGSIILHAQTGMCEGSDH